MFTYVMPVEIPTRELSSAVGRLETELNDTMHGFGFQEKAILVTTLPFTLDSSAPLTEAQLAEAARIVEAGVREKFTNCKFGTFKLKPPASPR